MRLFVQILSLLAAANGFAQTLHFGTNIVRAGEMVRFVAPLNIRARAEAGHRSGEGARGALFLPAGLTNLARPQPLLIVTVPSGGSSIRWLPAVTNVAWQEGWAVLAADGPKVPVNEDTIQWGWAMLSSVLDHVTRTWPQTKQWPVVCAGFSGGAKRAAAVGAALTHEKFNVTGIFLGGCNEDRATLGMTLFLPGERYKEVPFFLSNGAADPIAGPAHAEGVVQLMRRTGFTRIKQATYEGGHRFNSEHLREALRWFRAEAESGQRLPPRGRVSGR